MTLVRSLRLSAAPVLRLVRNYHSSVYRRRPHDHSRLLSCACYMTYYINLASTHVVKTKRTSCPCTVTLKRTLRVIGVVQSITRSYNGSGHVCLPGRSVSHFKCALRSLHYEICSPQLRRLLGCRTSLTRAFFTRTRERCGLLDPRSGTTLVPTRTVTLVCRAVLSGVGTDNFHVFSVHCHIGAFRGL